MPGGRHAKLAQSLVADLANRVHADVVGLECVGVVVKADRRRPTADIAHAASSSSNTLASLRIGVSKPSVNQP